MNTHTQSIVDRIREIAAEGCCIGTTDSGNGCAGPMSYSPNELEQLADEGEFDAAYLDPDSGVDYCKALDQLGLLSPGDQTEWYVVTTDYDGGYRKHWILWQE